MPLLIDPPPNKFPVAPDSTGRYPGSSTVRGEVIGQGTTNDIVVFGRNGSQPDATQAAWLSDAIATLPVNSFAWMHWAIPLGRVTIAVELRSATEIAAAGAGHGPGVGTVFAVTGWDNNTFPPLDGLSSDGQGAGNWAPTSWLRILIREDLATGGAGPEWAGRNFLIETMMHEFGHAAVLHLMDLYGEDYVKACTCDLFGKPAADWDDQTLPWAERVSEANAEFFKDVTYAARRYSSRTAYTLPQARFNDWVELFFDMLYVPYWSAGNTGITMRAIQAPGDNLGACSYVTQIEAEHLRFIPDGISRAAVSDPQLFSWPPVGSMRIHWAYDPRPVFDPGFGLWEDLIFVEAPPPGPPNGYASPALFAGFYDFSETTLYGQVEVPVWRGGATGASGVQGITVPPDVLAAVPAETGCDVVFAFGGHTLPKYDMPGDDFLWPWADWSLRRPRPHPTEIAWPYGGAQPTATLQFGGPRNGRIQIARGYLGRYGPGLGFAAPPIGGGGGGGGGVLATLTAVTEPATFIPGAYPDWYPSWEFLTSTGFGLIVAHDAGASVSGSNQVEMIRAPGPVEVDWFSTVTIADDRGVDLNSFAPDVFLVFTIYDSATMVELGRRRLTVGDYYANFLSSQVAPIVHGIGIVNTESFIRTQIHAEDPLAHQMVTFGRSTLNVSILG